MNHFCISIEDITDKSAEFELLFSGDLSVMSLITLNWDCLTGFILNFLTVSSPSVFPKLAQN